jgi:hypothetical protein
MKESEQNLKTALRRFALQDLRLSRKKTEICIADTKLGLVQLASIEAGRFRLTSTGGDYYVGDQEEMIDYLVKNVYDVQVD